MFEPCRCLITILFGLVGESGIAPSCTIAIHLKFWYVQFQWKKISKVKKQIVHARSSSYLINYGFIRWISFTNSWNTKSIYSWKKWIIEVQYLFALFYFICNSTWDFLFDFWYKNSILRSLYYCSVFIT